MTIDRTRPPALAPARLSPFPSFERHALANGLPVLCLPHREVPLYTLRYIGSAASSYDLDRPGRALLAASLLDEGTATRSATEIAEQIEQRGGSIGSGCDWDTSFLSVGMLAQDLGFGIELVAECLLAATFAAEETDRIRSRFLAEVKRREDEPDALANERFSHCLYAAGPYSHPPIGNASVLADLSPSELREFVSSHALSHESFVVAVGYFETGQLLDGLESAFGSTERADSAAPPLPEPRGLSEREIHIVDRPEAQQ
ncbi:MAG: insulinase family protein, partial [Acidobacteriota bacterium]